MSLPLLNNPKAPAQAVARELLEVTREAYMARDFEAFAKHVQLPNLIETSNGETTMIDHAALVRIFDEMCATFDALGVVDLHRRSTSASFLDAHTIETHFVTRHVLANAKFGAEVVGVGILRFSGERWLVAEHHYSTPSAPILRALAPK